MSPLCSSCRIKHQFNFRELLNEIHHLGMIDAIDDQRSKGNKVTATNFNWVSAFHTIATEPLTKPDSILHAAHLDLCRDCSQRAYPYLTRSGYLRPLVMN